MPTRKQRRRRQKDLRHEWEEVYVDAEGRELAPEEVEELAPKRAATNGRTERTKDTRAPAKKSSRTRRPAREVQPPSWRRVLRRAAIFAPLMFLFIAFTSRNTGPAEDVLVTVWLLLVFIPFSYLMDRFTYRIWQKRVGRMDSAASKAPKRR
jgi:hypothetical protein